MRITLFILLLSFSSQAQRPFKNYIGVNGFEWNFQSNWSPVDETKGELIKPFDGFRHYLDWGRVEPDSNKYTYQPTINGGWGYDDIYTWCKENSITVLLCLKNCPDWLVNTYPEDQRDGENSPLPYGWDKSSPSSYKQMAKLGFQLAARYGSNTGVNPSLLSVEAQPSWAPNQKLIGLDLITYIECNNEPDKDWKGPKAQQSPEEYAANLSAFYDGHLGTLGAGVGVKNADPNMKVVMAGTAGTKSWFLKRMIQWCHTYRADSLCFDVINFHDYSQMRNGEWWSWTPDLSVNRGVAPEVSPVGDSVQVLINIRDTAAPGMPIWITECGFDVNASSIQRALAIGSKNTRATQADWSLRTSLFYARKRIDRVFFYMLEDVDINSPTQYASCGLIEDGERRPAADFLLQAKNLLGDYHYDTTINSNPLVDRYKRGDSTIYALIIPDEIGRTGTYQLDLSGTGVTQVKVYTPTAGQDHMAVQTLNVTGGTVDIPATETPVFVHLFSNSVITTVNHFIVNRKIIKRQ